SFGWSSSRVPSILAPKSTRGSSMRSLIRLLVTSLVWTVIPAASFAQDFGLPGFTLRDARLDGVTIHVRSGGSGPAVVLLHGYGENGDMWAPLAADLARDHTVIVPDLRGLGLSSKPQGGFDKKTQAADIADTLNALKIDTAATVRAH